MRLYELYHPSKLSVSKAQAGSALQNGPSKASYNMDYFTHIMRDAGFTRLGDGAYASVYAHPRYNYVFKVFRSSNGYNNFLDYCYQNISNPHLPRIHGRAKRIDQSYWCVRLERLQEYPNDRYLDYYFEVLESAANRYLKIGSAEPFDYDRFLEGFQEEIRNDAPLTPLLCKTIVDLTKINKKSFLDFHSGNFMKRGQTVVIIDPYAD